MLRRGFRSAHIADFFTSIRTGHDLADLLGLQAAIFGDRRRPTAVPVPVTWTTDARHARSSAWPMWSTAARFTDREIAEIVSRSGEPVGACARARPQMPTRSTIWPPRGSGAFGSIPGANFPGREWELNVVTDYRDLIDHVTADLLRAAVERHLVAAVWDFTLRSGQRVGAGYVAVTPGGGGSPPNRCASHRVIASTVNAAAAR
jgi:hypothetical protein